MKCGEEKPACLRCTSTGRVCDGYDRVALARYRPSASTQTAELAKVEFVRACQQSEALRSMRRIEADMDGTETEKRLVAKFRAAATADGVAARLCSITAFWGRLAQSTACQDEAVKHAVVALAAAYQLFQRPDEPVLEGFTRANLDLFAIQQYNKAIERLQSHASSSTPQSVRVTLLCCLAFISLETLRGNHSVAVSHLTNGLRILQSLPDSTSDYLADDAILVWPPTRHPLQMPDIIQQFARLEVLTCFFTHGLEPVVSERGYRTRRFDDGSREGPFADVSHARRAMCRFQHDAMARLHEMATVAAAPDNAAARFFWSDPAQQRQQACLLARSARLGALADSFFSPAGFGSPDPTTPESFSLYLDLLYFRCAQFLVASQTPMTTTTATTPPPTTTAVNGDPFFPYHPPFLSPFQQQQPQRQQPDLYHYPPSTAIPPEPHRDPAVLLPSILHLATRLLASPLLLPLTTIPTPNSSSHRPRPLPELHGRLLGPLCLVAAHAPDDDEGTPAAAVRLLAEAICGYNSRTVGGHGADGDGGARVREAERLVRRAVCCARDGNRARARLGAVGWEVPRAVVGVAGLPLLWGVGGVGGSERVDGDEGWMDDVQVWNSGWV